jgi:two-component system cell cycle response regulator DivK
MTPTGLGPDVESGLNRGHGQLVLVVEDNDKNARLTVAMLDSAGYRTRLASNGDDGLRLAGELCPALIITDLQMPGLDGVDMTRALKSRARTASIPVIAVTAHALTEHRHAALTAGCCRFLPKPIRYRALLAEVADVIACEPTGTT